MQELHTTDLKNIMRDRMIIKKVILDNIKSHKHSEVDFYPGVNSIIGPQGSGKSTILEAIGVTLFQSLDYNQKHFIRKGEKSGEIQIIFEVDGKEYKAVKSFGSNAEYYIEVAGDRVVELKEQIVPWIKELLKIDSAKDLTMMFEQLIGPPQGTHRAPFLLTPSARKRMFDPILGLEAYADAWSRLRGVERISTDKSAGINVTIEKAQSVIETMGDPDEEIKEISSTILELEKERDILTSKNSDIASKIDDCLELEEIQIHQNEIKVVRKALKPTLEQLKKDLDQLKKLDATFPVLEKSYNEHLLIKEKIQAFEKELAILPRTLNDLEKIKQQISDANMELMDLKHDLTETNGYLHVAKNVDSISRKMQEIRSRMSTLESLISHYQGYEDNIQHNICPIDKEPCPRDIKDIIPQLIEEKENEFEECSLTVQKIGKDYKLAREAKSIVDTRVVIQAKIDSNEKILVSHEKECEELEKVSKVLRSLEIGECKILKDRIAKLNVKDYHSVKSKIEGIEPIKGRIEGIRLTRKQLKKEISDLDAKLEGYDPSIISPLREELRILTIEISTKHEKLRTHKESIARLMLESDKLKSLKKQLEEAESKFKDEEAILENIKWARKLMKDIPPHLVRQYLLNVNYDANQIINEISDEDDHIIDWMEDYELTMDGKIFKQLSGGESMVATLSVRLALLQNLSKIDIAFFDEPTDGLDYYHRERLGYMMSNISKFRQLIVISHDNTFETVIENSIHISKGSKGITIID